MLTATEPSHSSRWQRLVLWLWVMNLGVAFGAGLYEARIVVPDWLYVLPSGQWFWNAAAARHSDTGLRFWAYVSTGPLTLLTLTSLVLAFRASKPLRNTWLLGAGVGFVERVFTFVYFIPKMLDLMSEDLTQSAAVPVAQQWQAFNEVRHVLLLVAWVVSLKAFAMAAALAPTK